MKYFLGIAAGITMLSNVMLAYYLIRERFGDSTIQQKKRNVLNFVLTPDIKMHISEDTEILATEVISKEMSCNG